MKYTYFCLLALFVLASCSPSKYTYNFDYYDYNSGRKPRKEFSTQAVHKPVLLIDEKSLVASSKESEVYISKPTPPMTKTEAKARVKSMSRAEREELRIEIKNYVREVKKSNIDNSENASKALTGDLKRAVIFGAVGLVLLIIGGDVLFILGAAALIVGLFFFIRYLSRQ